MRSKGSLWRSVLSPAQEPLLAPVVVPERMLTHLAPDPDFFSNTGDNLSPLPADGESDYLAPQGRNNKGGMIAGTVIGVLLGVAALLGLLFWLWRKRQAHNNKASTTHGGDGHGQVQPSTPTTSNAPNKAKGEAEFMVNVHGDFKGVKLPESNGSINSSKKMPRINSHGDSKEVTYDHKIPESSGSINSSNSVQSSTPNQRGTNSFTYEEVFEATNGFSKSNVIGQGGFGHVYQGVLSSGKIVAIKQLKVGSHQGEREFLAEIDTISHIHHRNLVSLIGYSNDKNQKLLVYEYMANNSLAYHLHGSEPQSVLSWDLRMQIAVGSAKGLAYLHEDCDPKIIHRDIKANNILLDSNFNAKVSDFGLAKFVAEAETHVTTRVMGTFGYLAPEYASSGKLTEKSDVYSFGIVLLELISGRPPLNLVEWVRPLLPHALTHDIYDELADPKLNNCYDNVGMGRMLACVEACIHPFAHNRPQMVQVARVLQGIMSPSDLQRQS